MPVHADAFPDFGNFTLAVDQVRAPLDAHTLLAIHVLFTPGPVKLRDLVLFVDE